MNTEPLTFYPEHPSNEKTRQIETTDMPLLPQQAPFAVGQLHEAFASDLNGALQVYGDKRFDVTGIALKVGPDVHNKPSIELGASLGGPCHALVIFPTDDHYRRVSVGDRVTVRGNFLVLSNWFGVVMKHSQLVDVVKE